MKKHFSFLVGLFLVMFTSLHCFAAGSAEEQYAKGGRHHKTAKLFLEKHQLFIIKK